MSIASFISNAFGALSGIKQTVDLSRQLGASMGPLISTTTMPQLPTATARPGVGFVTAGRFPSASSAGTRGYHPAKDGSGRMVRNRRMNPCNATALRRAARRIKSFRKLAHKVEMSLPKHTVRTRAKR